MLAWTRLAPRPHRQPMGRFAFDGTVRDKNVGLFTGYVHNMQHRESKVTKVHESGKNIQEREFDGTMRPTQ